MGMSILIHADVLPNSSACFFIFCTKKSRVLLMLFSSLYEDCFAYSFTLLNRGKPTCCYSFSNATFSNGWAPTVAVFILLELTSSVASFLGTVSVNLPSLSDVVCVVVPFMVIHAPETGFPAASVTRPATSDSP